MADRTLQRDLPEPVKECEKSIRDDNPDMDKATAIAICQDMHNTGELADGCPTVELESDCPEGQIRVNGECIEPTTIDAPPALLSDPVEFQLSDLETEPIEREELGDNRVAYRNVKILQAGEWTDANSRETVWYSPEGLANMELTEDNAINIMHDSDNEVAEVGLMDNLREENGALFADLIFETDSPAGEFADENMQHTLETQGAEGFGGPSVEIPPEGQEIEINHSRGVKELIEGLIDGLGLVKNPASKPVSFARQTAERGVALSDSQTDKGVYRLNANMDDSTRQKILREIATRELQVEDIQPHAEAIADELDIPVAEVMEVLDPILDMDESENGGEGDTQNADDEEREGASDDDEEEEDDEDEDDEMDMAEVENRFSNLEERLGNLEDMMDTVMSEEELTETLEETTETLADAETVQELAEAKEELEKRLSELEDEPKEPKTLADGDGTESDVDGTISPVHSRVRR